MSFVMVMWSREPGRELKGESGRSCHGSQSEMNGCLKSDEVLVTASKCKICCSATRYNMHNEAIRECMMTADYSV